jgi:hypothetical protein
MNEDGDNRSEETRKWNGPPAAISEDALQAAGMARRETSLEKLLSYVDRYQRRSDRNREANQTLAMARLGPTGPGSSHADDEFGGDAARQ